MSVIIWTKSSEMLTIKLTRLQRKAPGLKELSVLLDMLQLQQRQVILAPYTAMMKSEIARHQIRAHRVDLKIRRKLHQMFRLVIFFYQKLRKIFSRIRLKRAYSATKKCDLKLRIMLLI